ncbi:MAG TPA: hypothetical protein VGO40_12055 [Longimicrobium sp.]|jgi:hypothetical protein|nr:hypothetical protein [Longimicrobium sp.]
MKQDSAEAQLGGATSAAQPRPQPADHHLVYCGCTHPMHPEHVEKRRGVMMERYSCPKRRWWNAWHHPHTWMAPRDNVPK